MGKYLNPPKADKMPKYLNKRQGEEVNLQNERAYDLQWVDEFIGKIKPYIYVREQDQLLILIPNQAYKLNGSGIKILRYLMHGHGISDLLQLTGDDADKRRDMHYFFCDLRAVVSGCLNEQEERKAIDYYEYNGEFNEYPVLSEIAVTYRCNLSCEFCYVGDREYGELNTNGLKRILLKIYQEAKVPSVSFTGGEPLLRKDLGELVSYASRIGLWTNLITNGTLLNSENVKALKEAGLSSAQVSIEGPNPDVHDRITGLAGSFRATRRGIGLLRDAGIPVHTNTTISKNNIVWLRDIIDLAKDLGLSRLSMNLLIPCGAAQNRKDIWILYSDISVHILELKRHAASEGIKFLWYSPLPMCKFNPIAHGLGNKSCAAITGLLSVDPLGNIIPCSSWREPVGSLFKQHFCDIWQSETMKYYKNAHYAPQECRTCVHFESCKGACPLYWRACGKEEIIERT